MPRILLIDIETRPNLGYVWSLWQQNVGIGQLKEVSEVICYGAKWVGEKKVHFQSAHHDGKEAMLQGVWDLLNEADFVVGWNSKSFDMKHLKREFLLAGMPPTSPWKDLDLMLAVRSQFRFTSNKLDYVSQQMGVGAKVKHEGFQLWLDCMAGDEAAWRKMKKYQIQDVLLLEPLYERLKPWIPNHPNVNLYDGGDGCPLGSSHAFEKRGYAYTGVAKYQQYHCTQEGCGKWFRGKTMLSTTEAR